jgi:hypothetical protein
MMPLHTYALRDHFRVDALHPKTLECFSDGKGEYVTSSPLLARNVFHAEAA